MAAAWEHALRIAVSAGRANCVGAHDQARAEDQTRINGAAQVNRRPIGVERCHVPQHGEAVAHALLAEVQVGKRLDRGALQRLLFEVQAVQAKMDVSVDETWDDGPVAEVDDPLILESSDRLGDVGYGIELDQDLGAFSKPIADALEELAAPCPARLWNRRLAFGP